MKSVRVPILPDDKNVELAASSAQVLAEMVRSGCQEFQLITTGGTRGVVLPTSAIKMLSEMMEEIGKGNAVSLTTHHAELTTAEAAAMINVSRPTLIQLLEQGQIPYRRLNAHRRIRLDDLMRYKNQLHTQRMKVLDELAAQAQELDLGY